MSKQILISPTMQFIIDKVREIRLELGLTQRDVSRFLKPDSDSNLLGNIESPLRNASYTDHNLNILANKFSSYSEKQYTIYDFYPKEPLSDILQKKTKTDIFKVLFPTASIYILIEETKFLASPKTVKEISEYSNKYFSRDWKTKDFNSPLDRASEKGDLKKIEHPDGSVQYQKT